MSVKHGFSNVPVTKDEVCYSVAHRMYYISVIYVSVGGGMDANYVSARESLLGKKITAIFRNVVFF